jgi:3-deoxy-D-manno-octulosonic-acid transferase
LATPFWYNTALHLLKPFIVENKKTCRKSELYHQECLKDLGRFKTEKCKAIWFHAVSVGETNAAQPLIEHYLKLGHPVLVTNTTKQVRRVPNHFF